MNLGNDLNFFMQQGPVFWAAAASVGLGGTLLVSAIFVWIRRRISGLRLPFGGMNRRGQGQDAVAGAIAVDETGYSLSGPPPALRREPSPENPEATRELQLLLARLREAGDRLETALEVPADTGIPHSGLKVQVQDVEIETRVGVG